MQKIMQICLEKVNSIPSDSWIELNKYATFIKGIEVGSKQYIESNYNGLIPYYRVGDLGSDNPSIYIDPSLKHQSTLFEDIIISFDGAPGRINIGCKGAYSSGLQKVLCDKHLKGLVFFALCGNKNQEIIKNYSQGTTILHASKSIQFLMIPELINEEILKYNDYFLLLLTIKRKIVNLQNIKKSLLNKYFTNQ